MKNLKILIMSNNIQENISNTNLDLDLEEVLKKSIETNDNEIACKLSHELNELDEILKLSLETSDYETACKLSHELDELDKILKLSLEISDHETAQELSIETSNHESAHKLFEDDYIPQIVFQESLKSYQLWCAEK
jgi:antirestriction protein